MACACGGSERIGLDDVEALIGPERIATLLGLVDATGNPRVSAVYELSRSRSADPLPTFRVGKYLRARPSELAAWIERQRIQRLMR